MSKGGWSFCSPTIKYTYTSLDRSYPLYFFHQKEKATLDCCFSRNWIQCTVHSRYLLKGGWSYVRSIYYRDTLGLDLFTRNLLCLTCFITFLVFIFRKPSFGAGEGIRTLTSYRQRILSPIRLPIPTHRQI